MNNGLAIKFQQCVGQLLEPTLPTAVLDFPDHGNVGDSAIWAGEARLIEGLGCRINYSSDISSYSEIVLRQRMPFGQILLHGGGNFGTVWPENQAWRESILDRLRDFRVIQLPQTIQFSSNHSIERAASRIANHPDFTLLVRDKRSQYIAESRLGARTILCPDAAFMLEGELNRRDPKVDVLVLSRSDHEASKNSLSGLSIPGLSLARTDWLDEPATATRRNARVWKKISKTSLGGLGIFQRVHWQLLNKLADERIKRGVEILSRGRIVITDRLHAHILCTLLGIPHVVLDNNYGKIHDFINCWHPNHPLVHMASSTDEAVAKAQSLLEAL